MIKDFEENRTMVKTFHQPKRGFSNFSNFPSNISGLLAILTIHMRLSS